MTMNEYGRARFLEIWLLSLLSQSWVSVNRTQAPNWVPKEERSFPSPLYPFTALEVGFGSAALQGRWVCGARRPAGT